MTHSLIEIKDSQLIVIDVQNSFLNKLEKTDSKVLINRINWIIHLAKWCEVPITVTAELLQEDPIQHSVVKSLPNNIATFDKHSFGLTGQKNIFNHIRGIQANTAILIGLETDVCVMQSALGLLDKGFTVVVIEDATGSPEKGQQNGIQRIREAGVIVTNMKGLFYEWLRTVDNVNRFHKENPQMRDTAGIIL